MTRLRKMMLEELERRNYSQATTRCYLRAVADCARYFHRSPDPLRPEHVREYQAYLFRERKLDAGTVTQPVAALRFFFLKTLKNGQLPIQPKCQIQNPEFRIGDFKFKISGVKLNILDNHKSLIVGTNH
jgi:site-specific recombinase XerD